MRAPQPPQSANALLESCQCPRHIEVDENARPPKAQPFAQDIGRHEQVQRHGCAMCRTQVKPVHHFVCRNRSRRHPCPVASHQGHPTTSRHRRKHGAGCVGELRESNDRDRMSADDRPKMLGSDAIDQAVGPVEEPEDRANTSLVPDERIPSRDKKVVAATALDSDLYRAIPSAFSKLRRGLGAALRRARVLRRRGAAANPRPQTL